MRLSAPMHDALIAAARNPLRRTHDAANGKPPWPAHPATLAALVHKRHGYLIRKEERNRKGFKVDIWLITDAGRDALNPPPKHRPDRPLFMSRRGYTTDPGKSIDHDAALGAGRGLAPLRNKTTAVAVVKLDDVARFTVAAREREQERRRRNGQALDAQAVELRLEQARLVARERGMDVSGELWVIRQIVATGREQSAARRLAKLETQLQQRAA